MPRVRLQPRQLTGDGKFFAFAGGYRNATDFTTYVVDNDANHYVTNSSLPLYQRGAFEIDRMYCFILPTAPATSHNKHADIKFRRINSLFRL